MILDLLKRITQSLDDADILYMVSGSMALITYTVPRMTRDIDIVIELSAHDVVKFCAIFKTGFYIDSETVAEEVKRRGMFNVIDHKTGYKIDFIVRKNSVYRQTEFDRRIKTNVFGFDIWLVSLEDLIISKIIWIQELQSDRQISDIENLLTNEDADKTYIRDWCQKLHLETFNIRI